MATLETLLKSKSKATVRGQLIQALRGVGYVKHTGTGTGTVAVSGTALTDSALVIEIQSSGTPGNSNAAYRYSLDGGRTWANEHAALPSSLDLTGQIGVIVTFAGVTSSADLPPFIAGDTYSCQLVKPRFPTTAWQPFSVPVTLLDIQAEGLSDLTDLISVIGRGGILDLAEGEWLDLLAMQIYEVERGQAQKAVLRFLVADVDGMEMRTLSARQLVVRDERGHRFTNLAAAEIPPSGSAVVEFEALEAGVGHNFVSGNLLLETTVAGLRITPNEKVGNGDALIKAAGTPRESDDELRERCKGKWGMLGRVANSEGYAAWILEEVSTITRCIVLPSENVAGQVEIYLANASGSASEDEAAAAEQALREKTPTCVRVNIQGVTEKKVCLKGKVDVLTGMEDAVSSAIKDGLATLCANTPIGGHVVGDRRILSRESIIAMIMGISGVLDCELDEPAIDIALEPTEVPVCVDDSVELLALMKV